MNDDQIPETREDGEIVDVVADLESRTIYHGAQLVGVIGSPIPEEDIPGGAPIVTPKPSTAPLPRPALDRIQACERDCARASQLMEYTKSEAKHAKDAFDAAVDRLRQAVRDSFQPDLPFAESPHHPKGDTDPANDDGADWKTVPLTEAISGAEGVTATMLAKLAEADINTVGDLAAYINAGSRLIDIKGIGETKAEKIEAALEGFWERRKAAGSDPENEATGTEE